MGVLWTWLPKWSVQTELVVQDDLPDAADEYGERDTDSLKRPTERASFTAEGLTVAEVMEVYLASKARPPAYTAETALGDFVGLIETFEGEQIAGTEYCTASLTMLTEETPFDE